MDKIKYFAQKRLNDIIENDPAEAENINKDNN
jgi:hypothetical protein